MTVSLEKLFFKYILYNKRWVGEVKPSFFMNPEIRLVYSCVYDYMMKNSEADIPKPAQVFEMVEMVDKDKKLSKNAFKLLYSTNLDEYDETHFIKPKLKAWLLKEYIKVSGEEIIEMSRDLDKDTDLDFEKFQERASELRESIIKNTSTNFDDDSDLGSDFDDEEAHSQDLNLTKIKTGWNSLDAMINGGLDIDTLNILMGQTNSGKSLWMQNIAANIANNGYNVVYFTLEMSEKKVMKRLGSMRLRVPINDYDRVSKNSDYIKQKIGDLKDHNNMGGDIGSVFTKDVGKINVKFFAAGTATIETLENHLVNLEKKKGFIPNVIIVDYITLMTPIKGMGLENNLYLKGKHLSESLRAMGSKRGCPVVTAMQLSKDAWNASDITLDKIPESKAIAETADTFWAIIRTEEMRRNNRYVLKLLKQRDGDFIRSRASFDLNPKFLTIENDKLVDDDG